MTGFDGVQQRLRRSLPVVPPDQPDRTVAASKVIGKEPTSEL